MNSDLSRRQLLLAAAGAMSLAAGGPARAATLPAAVSLADELARALQQKQPLVVMVSLHGCPFCKVVRDNYLAPMHTQDGLPVVQVDMRSNSAVRDLKGRATTHDAVTRAWGIKIAPTVLFLGRGGQEVAERLVGAYLPDFYGAYLDERLQQARNAVR